MVRTGLRLGEQTALSVLELPEPIMAARYQRFWLPEAIAKGRSARWIYVPRRVLRAIHEYIRVDRRDCIERGRARGLYADNDPSLIYLDPAETGRRSSSERPRSARLEHLTASERERAVYRGEDGWEPVALWVSEEGSTITRSTWKAIFREANLRCARQEISLAAHAHLLRHTFAVLTLEQLQRGHISALSELSASQRTHYTRVFGDPLDWVRRRLGHRSVVTTQIYLHALEQLEMETRLKLIPDLWDDPRDPAMIGGSGEDASE